MRVRGWALAATALAAPAWADGPSAALTLTGFSSLSEEPLAPGLRLRHDAGNHRVDLWYERSLKRREAGGNGGFYVGFDAFVGKPEAVQLGLGYRHRNGGPTAVDDRGPYGGWTKKTWRVQAAKRWLIDGEFYQRLTLFVEPSANATIGLDATMQSKDGAEMYFALYWVKASPLQSDRRVLGGVLGVAYRVFGR